MFSKGLSRSTVSGLGLVFFLTLCIGLPGAMADDCNLYGCDDDCEFTSYFRLEDCKFKDKGANPYFILKPGYQLVLESEDEKSIETVLCDTKKITLENGRRIKTRVVEERAIELDEESGKWKTVEISLNWFAICKKTNAVYYFGEWSRDCEDGFDENDECSGEESNDGSWEAGVDGAEPGLIMLGTPVKGGRYFQERAKEQDAVDRGEVVDVGFDFRGWSGCIEINDTNPAEGACDLGEDVKIYCPGVGLVQDQELELVWRGFVGCDDDDGDDNDDDDDDDDKRWKSNWKHGQRHY